MNAQEIGYALSKQVTSAYEVNSNYGAIALDEEMAAAVMNALIPILEKRLEAAERENK